MNYSLRLTFRLCILIVFSFFNLSLNAQSKDGKTINDIESYRNWVGVENQKIATAYNVLGAAVKKGNVKSVEKAMLNFIKVTEKVAQNAKALAINDSLNKVNAHYINWIQSLVDYNAAHANDLAQFVTTKNALLKANPDANTQYPEKQIQDFFKNMDAVQNQLRLEFLLEVERLRN
jgi:hypothetical protein